MKQIQTKQEQQKIYYPQDILEKCQSGLFQDIVNVSGYLTLDKNFPKLLYNNYSIGLENLNHAEIEDIYGKKVNISGYLTYFIHVNGGIYPKIRVNSIVVLDDEEVYGENYLREINEYVNQVLKNKQPFGFSDYFISLINQKEIPIKIALIHGKGAQVQYDFINGLKKSFISTVPLSHVLEIFTHEITISNDEELASTICSIAELESGIDAIYILRGGGSEADLSRIGGPKTAIAIAEINIPVYLALGHSKDKPNKLLSKVIADEFPTPSIAGTELGNILKLGIDILYKEETIEEKNQQINNEKNKNIELQRQIHQLTEQIQHLNKQKTKMTMIFLTIIFVMILIMIIKIIK